MNWDYAFSLFDVVKIEVKKYKQRNYDQESGKYNETFVDNFAACNKVISHINVLNKRDTYLELNLDVRIEESKK